MIFTQLGGELGIKAFLFVCDLLTVLIQTQIISSIYKKEKDCKIAKIIQIVLIFNPLAIISPAVHNLGILNHLLISILILTVIKSGYTIITDIICGVSLYVDPMLGFVIIPSRMAYALIGRGNFLKSLTIWFGTFQFILFTLSGNPTEDLRNYINIVSVKDHSENIGLFWYIFVELFKQHVTFYQVLYLLFFSVLSI